MNLDAEQNLDAEIPYDADLQAYEADDRAAIQTVINLSYDLRYHKPGTTEHSIAALANVFCQLQQFSRDAVNLFQALVEQAEKGKRDE